MKRIICFLMVVFCFSCLYGQEFEKVKTLSKEVKILNILNGIELSETQRESIRRSIKKVEAIEDDFESDVEEKTELFQAGLGKSVEVLSEGKELPPSLKKEISSHNHQLIEMHREKEEEIFEVALDVKNILEPQQVYQLETFIPCLVPPPGKARVGQTENHESIGKRLDKIRNLPENVYWAQRERIIDMVIKKEKQHLPILAVFDEEAERERIGSLLDEIRSMSDVDFALNMEEVSEEFKMQVERGNPESEVLRKIRGFLLDPLVLKYI